jgi:hypothetical protein
VITRLGWEKLVNPEDIDGLRDTLATDYQVSASFGAHTVLTLVTDASPPLVDTCAVATD